MLDGTGATDLYTGEGDLGGLAIDPGAGKIYWGDFSSGTVRVGRLDGAAPAQSLDTGESNPWFVALLRAPLGTGAPTGCGRWRGWEVAVVRPGELGSGLAERVPRSSAEEPLVSMDVGGAPIAGATTSSVVANSPGAYRCVVTAINAAGSASQTSAPTNVSAPPALTPSAPLVGGPTTARLSGLVDPDGLSTTAHYEYGLDPALRHAAGPLYDEETSSQTVGSDFAHHQLNVNVCGLVSKRSVPRAVGGHEHRRSQLRGRPNVHYQAGPGAATAGARKDSERYAGKRQGVHSRAGSVRAADGSKADPVGHRGRCASRDGFAHDCDREPVRRNRRDGSAAQSSR